LRSRCRARRRRLTWINPVLAALAITSWKAGLIMNSGQSSHAWRNRTKPCAASHPPQPAGRGAEPPARNAFAINRKISITHVRLLQPNPLIRVRPNKKGAADCSASPFKVLRE
jgi:hypothetical protein